MLKLAFASSGTPSCMLQTGSIVRATYQRNHSAMVFFDSLKLGSCEDVFGRSACILVMCSQGRCHDNSADLSETFLVALRKQNCSPDVILAAVFLEEADRISGQIGAPLVILSESTDDVPSIRSTSLRILPFYLGEKHWLRNAVASAICDLAVSVQDLVSFGARQNLHMIQHNITQRIPGIDITGPICPIARPIGFLRGDDELMARSSFAEINAYLESCGARFTYVTLPVENSAHEQQFYSALRTVAIEKNTCVFRYIPAAEPSSGFRRSSEGQRVKIADDTSAALPYVLHRHKSTLLLTSNVKGILYGAVLAESPIVYVGGDRFSCSLLWSAGI